MTNEQMYIAIFVPILWNSALFTFFWLQMKSGFDSLERCLDALKGSLSGLDARLKHLEER